MVSDKLTSRQSGSTKFIVSKRGSKVGYDFGIEEYYQELW